MSIVHARPERVNTFHRFWYFKLMSELKDINF